MCARISEVLSVEVKYRNLLVPDHINQTGVKQQSDLNDEHK